MMVYPYNTPVLDIIFCCNIIVGSVSIFIHLVGKSVHKHVWDSIIVASLCAEPFIRHLEQFSNYNLLSKVLWEDLCVLPSTQSITISETFNDRFQDVTSGIKNLTMQ